jgi:hypothetical protein
MNRYREFRLIVNEPETLMNRYRLKPRFDPPTFFLSEKWVGPRRNLRRNFQDIPKEVLKPNFFAEKNASHSVRAIDAQRMGK